MIHENVYVPDKSVKGRIGDICINPKTGKKYKCVSSYRDITTEEYEWVEVSEPTPKLEVPKKEMPEPKPAPEPKEPPKKEQGRPYENCNGYNGNRKQYNKQYRPNSN